MLTFYKECIKSQHRYHKMIVKLHKKNPINLAQNIYSLTSSSLKYGIPKLWNAVIFDVISLLSIRRGDHYSFLSNNVFGRCLRILIPLHI